MDIKTVQKELGISKKEIAWFFSMSADSFRNSTAKERYEKAVCRIYEEVKKKKNIE